MDTQDVTSGMRERAFFGLTGLLDRWFVAIVFCLLLGGTIVVALVPEFFGPASREWTISDRAGLNASWLFAFLLLSPSYWAFVRERHNDWFRKQNTFFRRLVAWVVVGTGLGLLDLYVTMTLQGALHGTLMGQLASGLWIFIACILMYAIFPHIIWSGFISDMIDKVRKQPPPEPGWLRPSKALEPSRPIRWLYGKIGGSLEGLLTRQVIEYERASVAAD